MILCLTFRSSIHFSKQYEVRVQLHSFACGQPVSFPMPFVEETVLFPLSGLGILVEHR